MSWEVTAMVLKTSLEPSKKLVMLAMADHANPDGSHIFPSIRTISDMASVSERTVQRVLAEMRELGVLVVVNEATYNRATEYRIDLGMLHAMRRREVPKCHPQKPWGVSPETSRGDNGDVRGVTSSDTLSTSLEQPEESTSNPLPSVGDARAQDPGSDLVPAKETQKALLEKIGIRVTAVIPEDVPVAAMVSSYHKHVPSGHRLEKITAPRVGALKRVWRELGKSPDAWVAFLQRVEASDWLTGRREGSNGPFTSLDLDWITGPKNFDKIQGGRYDNRQGSKIAPGAGTIQERAADLASRLV